jgi:hypothetical protein
MSQEIGQNINPQRAEIERVYIEAQQEMGKFWGVDAVMDKFCPDPSRAEFSDFGKVSVAANRQNRFIPREALFGRKLVKAAWEYLQETEVADFIEMSRISLSVTEEERKIAAQALRGLDKFGPLELFTADREAVVINAFNNFEEIEAANEAAWTVKDSFKVIRDKWSREVRDTLIKNLWEDENSLEPFAKIAMQWVIQSEDFGNNSAYRIDKIAEAAKGMRKLQDLMKVRVGDRVLISQVLNSEGFLGMFTACENGVRLIQEGEGLPYRQLVLGEEGVTLTMGRDYEAKLKLDFSEEGLILPSYVGTHTFSLRRNLRSKDEQEIDPTDPFIYIKFGPKGFASIFGENPGRLNEHDVVMIGILLKSQGIIPSIYFKEVSPQVSHLYEYDIQDRVDSYLGQQST